MSIFCCMAWMLRFLDFRPRLEGASKREWEREIEIILFWIHPPLTKCQMEFEAITWCMDWCVCDCKCVTIRRAFFVQELIKSFVVHCYIMDEAVMYSLSNILLFLLCSTQMEEYSTSAKTPLFCDCIMFSYFSCQQASGTKHSSKNRSYRCCEVVDIVISSFERLWYLHILVTLFWFRFLHVSWISNELNLWTQ